jgi:enterochelin esterase-like enzyme
VSLSSLTAILLTLSSSPEMATTVITRIYSTFLKREVTISVLLPPGHKGVESLPLVLFNDGQDFQALAVESTFTHLLGQGRIMPCMLVGIHANEARVSEYGIAAQPDYAGRGDKAGPTTQFVMKELIPFLVDQYHVKPNDATYAGFSLGGLMALDIVWNNPDVFSRVGVFSGALWWRQKSLDAGYQDSDRIMHLQIRTGSKKPGLQFWFQCGTLDETDDRDGDGVIDAIQDTLECIAELERKGYAWKKDIQYVEVKGGRHDQQTWSEVLPHFLQWAMAR